jgi:energy-coupling factor transporter ATP-binding protein EcfA2
MLGRGRRAAARRLVGGREVAELRGLVERTLKDYSSGMVVRLAFAVMVEANADVMLVDEVLAVGDAAFGQKYMDVFRAKRKAGKTLVLVTHDMATVQAFCDRAMLIHDGEQRFLGDPEEAALRYYRLNFGGQQPDPASGSHPAAVPDVNVKLIDVWLEDQAGQRVDNVEQEKVFRFNLLVEDRQPMSQPIFNFHCLNMDGDWVFAFSKEVEKPDGRPVAQGERIRLVAEIENPLLPNRYAIECWISRNREEGNMAIHILRLLDFFVYGTKPAAGNVIANAEVQAVREPVGRV